MIELGKKARAAGRKLAHATPYEKEEALLLIAQSLLDCKDEIFQANQIDLAAGKEAWLSTALLDRLTLNQSRLEGIVSDLRNVAALPDPVGEMFDAKTLPNGLKIHKQRVPLGVLGVIYEARPNVTIDVAGLALKTGNAAILRGGSETIHTNRALVGAIHQTLANTQLPVDAIQFVDDPDRERVLELLQMDEYVDIVIPRGGVGLHEFCRKNSRIPVITGGIGICHLFVDETANQEAALEVLRNAKIQRPTVCNALDTALVHRSIAPEFLPRLVNMLEKDGVTFKADEETLAILPSDKYKSVSPTEPGDFDVEWLSLTLGIKVVNNLDEAIAHISEHSTGHSDGILTQDKDNVERFVREVDSAAVYVNASTRFTDGGQFGLGAEVAISTQRLHARGPMGLQELTTYKWVVIGENHIRS